MTVSVQLYMLMFRNNVLKADKYKIYFLQYIVYTPTGDFPLTSVLLYFSSVKKKCLKKHFPVFPCITTRVKYFVLVVLVVDHTTQRLEFHHVGSHH